jgi:hypothetical protein
VLSVILGITLMPGVAQGQLIENLVLFDEDAGSLGDQYRHPRRS